MRHTAMTTRPGALGDTTNLHHEFDRVLRDAFGGLLAPSTAGAWSPALDVEEHEEGFVLYVELPGVASEDLEVSLEENVLTIAGERRFYGDRDADAFRRVERSFGRFHRAVRLPDRVDGAAVRARFRDGVLQVDVPKAEEAKPRRIDITTD